MLASATGSRPIVLFTGSFVMGGMEEHVRQLARGLARRGFRVAAVCSPRPSLEPLRDDLRRSNVDVRTLPERGGRGGAGVQAAQRLLRLVSTLRRYPGCILHVHSPCYSGADLMLLAGRLAGAHAVVRTEHGTSAAAPGALAQVHVSLRDRLLSKIIWVCEPAEWDLHARVKPFPARSAVIRNGVDLEQFTPQAARPEVIEALGIEPGVPIVGTVTRLGEERKGGADFIEMAARVAQTNADARFLIVGDGPLRARLEHLAQARGLHQRVTFAGERRDVSPYLAAMDVFVLPSRFESGPITILEAMAMARPVVSTPVGIVPEVVHDRGTGRLVPVGDPHAMASAVLDLLSQPAEARRLGERGRAAVAASFSVDGMVDSVAHLYQQLG